MVSMGRLTTILITLTFFGCKGTVQTSAASGVASASTASTGGTRDEAIQDPSLEMKAFDVTVPAKWHFQGTLEQGGKCVPTPFPVFRVSSPDGLSSLERMPSLGWRWGTGPMMQSQQTDCLPLTGPMGAQDLLKYLAAMMKVEYLGDAPVPEEENARAQTGLRNAEAVYAPKYAAQHLTPPVSTRELARAYVLFQNGTFKMRGMLATTVDCSETRYPGLKSILRGMPDRPDSDVHQCSAGVRYLTAPENQFPSTQAMWDAQGMGARGNPAWSQAWVERNNEQGQAAIARMREQTKAAMDAQQQRFQHDMAVQQHIHEEFLSTMQRGTDMSMARTQESMNARSTAASDWVDYALDQRTVLDPGTGQVSKVSSSYNHTWIDSTGKTSYQTNDPNANPNGVLPGNWTQQQNVHGDGTR